MKSKFGLVISPLITIVMVVGLVGIAWGASNQLAARRLVDYQQKIEEMKKNEKKKTEQLSALSETKKEIESKNAELHLNFSQSESTVRDSELQLEDSRRRETELNQEVQSLLEKVELLEQAEKILKDSNRQLDRENESLQNFKRKQEDDLDVFRKCADAIDLLGITEKSARGLFTFVVQVPEARKALSKPDGYCYQAQQILNGK